MQRLLFLATVVAIVWVTPRVGAQAVDPAAAEAVFRAGREAARAGYHGLACEKFRESYRLQPAVGTVLNIAICEEELGELASAWQHYHEVLQRLAPDDARTAVAKMGVERLEPRVPRLVIRLAKRAPADTRVERAGVVLTAASFDVPLPVNPGDHVVLVKATGRDVAQYHFTLAEAEVLELEVAPGPALSLEPGDVDAEQVGEAEPTSPAPSREDRFWGLSGQVLLGLRETRWLAVNERLVQEGFTSLDTGRLVFGFFIEWFLWRARFGVDVLAPITDVRTVERSSGLSLKGRYQEAGPYLGFDVLRDDRLTLTALLGANIAALKFPPQADVLPSFLRGAEDLDPDHDVRARAFGTAIGGGTEYSVRLIGEGASEITWVFGTRVMYVLQHRASRWQAVGNNNRVLRRISDGPRITNHGWKVQFHTGIDVGGD